MRQLTFDLGAFSRDGLDGIVDHGGIHDALVTLKKVVSQGCVGCASPILIHGVSGSGKTTLLRSLVLSARISTLCPDSEIILIEPQLESSRFPDLERLDKRDQESETSIKLVALDDIHRLSGDDSYCFWNLYNKLNRDNATLVMTSRVHPSEMFQDNEHLRSRLLAGLVIAVSPPDDHERLLILDRMAKRRGFTLNAEVQKYILTRKPRNLKELDRIVKLIDDLSIETKRRVTIPLVKELEQKGLI